MPHVFDFFYTSCSTTMAMQSNKLQVYCYIWENQAFSQNLKSGRPGGMSLHKFVKALVHFASFSPRIGHPQDTWMPFWLKAWGELYIKRRTTFSDIHLRVITKHWTQKKLGKGC